MENGGFNPEESEPVTRLPLEEVVTDPKDKDAEDVLRHRSPPSPEEERERTAEEKEEEEKRRKDEKAEEEDRAHEERLAKYSLLSFLPNYEAKRSKMSNSSWSGTVAKYKKPCIMILLAVLYVAYFITMLSLPSGLDQEDYWCVGDGFMLIITSFVAAGLLYNTVKFFWGKQIYKNVMKPAGAQFDKLWAYRVVRWGFYLLLAGGIAAFYAVDTHGNRQRLMSLLGTFTLLFLGFVFSAAPRAIIWRHVVWGMAIQFFMGLFILRWSVGIAIFRCLGEKVSTFLSFTDQGSSFLFGDLALKTGSTPAIFAFSVLPVTLFFSFCVAILYYYGTMQWIVFKLGWLLQISVGTTMCESVNAAANIFLGQTEAPLVIKPFLSVMTKSELHAVLTGGFATIAGSVMAAYIKIGISPSHLISASVMSAPAALAYAKLFYPETEVSRTTSKNMPVIKSTEANVLHAAIEGVVVAIPLVANIAANLITFIAFVALFDHVFNWWCMLVDLPDQSCTFENVFGYVFMPLAFVMGVVWDEAHYVGTLIALKTIVNEFVAYQKLEAFKQAGVLSVRSQIISTYALCGFSNISSIGVQLGGIGALAPSRRKDIAQVILRAMIAGSAACFLTATIAGTLLEDTDLETG